MAAHAIYKRSEDSMSLFETGRRLIPPLELETLARLYGCSDEVMAELWELHAHAKRPGEFSIFGLPENLSTYLDLERAARVVRTFENLIIPGMLQTERYMRRLFQVSKVEASVVDQRVRARSKRQDRLYPSGGSSDPLQLIAVIAEEAVLRCARDPEAGPAQQFARLIKFAAQDNIEIRIMTLDAGVHAGIGGSFTCMDFPDDVVREFAYQETSSGGALTDLPSTVTHLNALFEELRSHALGPNESLTLVAQLAERGKEESANE